MRVAYFNELDSFCEINNLNTAEIIEGVSLDPRIGKYYNNPSFGYGGYCFPKDTKQLRANFHNIPNKLVSAIDDSNEIRKDFIFGQIMKHKPKIVGIYSLIMKSGSDNYRSAAIHRVIEKIKNKNIEVIIYEPTLLGYKYDDMEVLKSLDIFKSRSDIIVANRISDEIHDVGYKIYTRDLFGNDE